MSRRRLVLVSAAGLLVVAALSLVGWLVLVKRAARSLAESVSIEQVSKARNTNYGIRLMPIGEEALPERRPAEDVWSDLWTRIAEDDAAQKLLRRLYGERDVQFRVAPVTEESAGQLPDDGYDIVLCVDARPYESGVSDDVARVHRLIDLSRVSTVPFGTPARPQLGQSPADILGEAFAAALDGEPNDFLILMLVANDYLLRHECGWQLVVAGAGDDSGLPTGGPEVWRADLDRRITEYLERHGLE